ncbi:hypothetical protein BGZ81_008799 [Podila clonocystis]|nr:hypothetical protein BGZ81_008799 [Podila clonocystis]
MATTSSIPSFTTRPTHPPVAPPRPTSPSFWTMDPQNPAPSSTPTSTSTLPSSSDTARYDSSSGYIYIVLVIALLAALIFFGRAALLRRKERLRALKDPDYESGPPTYNRHVQDLQVVEDLSIPETALVRGEHYYIVTPRTTNNRHSASGRSNRRHRSQSLQPVVVVSVDHGDSSRTMVVGTAMTSTTTTTDSTDPTLPTYDDVVQTQARPASTQLVARPARSSSLSLPTLPDPPSYIATLAPTREEA